MQLDIPDLIAKYNDYRMAPSINVSMYIEQLAADKQPSACIGCGKCVKVCPQNINVPEALHAFADSLKSRPSWAELSRQRELEAMELRKKREAQK